MRDLYDELFSPSRFGRADRWDTEPDFDELPIANDDELENEEQDADLDELDLDEWLDAHTLSED